MNDRERGFLLLTSHLGDPERKVLTAAQLRALALRVRERKPEAEGRELTEKDLTELDYSEEAIASSYRDGAIADDLVAIGEVGLTGEIRSVSHLAQRLGEVSRLGFKKCIIPRSGSEKMEIPAGLTVYRVRNLREAIETAL